ncbi:hypothetical protein GCM10009115_13130 [Sphingopyxis soli]|uniref:Uncharacterized protein n=1 Tax=Sphingopyxis soli TaxID=592051 RepID=A0ABP3XC39_9SPHN
MISVISHAAPTDWIIDPMFDARLAIQMARKAGYRNGARGEEGEDCVAFTSLRLIAAPTGRKAACGAVRPGGKYSYSPHWRAWARLVTWAATERFACVAPRRGAGAARMRKWHPWKSSPA